MEWIKLLLPSGEEIDVALDRKKMKTCRLKVYPDQTVVLSLPNNAPDSWAISFVTDKSAWIEKKLEAFRETIGYAATTVIKNGYSIRMLGEDLILSVAYSQRVYIYQEGKLIHVCSPNIDNQEKIFTQFEKWWRKESLSIINQRIDQWYPIVEKYGVKKPHICIRKMKTLWGSCSVNRSTITFNQYLTKAKIPCIDYVVLHELTHFLYPNHSKQFYNFISIHMSDWKERKKMLDQDVVHGL